MKNYYSILKNCILFDAIESHTMDSMLTCFSAQEKAYKKGEFIFSVGEIPNKIGIVLSGAIRIIQEDYWGDRSILSKASPGDLFGEAFALTKVSFLPVSVIASEATTILLLNPQKIMIPCSSCACHKQLTQNMLTLLAQKNISLTQKIEHISKRTIREKLMSYLSLQSLQTKSSKFDLSFSRQELADYLAVDRSALSKELGKMQQDGILSYHRNHFDLH